MTGIGANATILSEYLEAIGLLLTPQAEEAQNCFLLLLLSRVAVRALFLLVSLIEMRISTRKFDVGVFTQPGPTTDIARGVASGIGYGARSSAGKATNVLQVRSRAKQAGVSIRLRNPCGTNHAQVIFKPVT